MEKAINWIFSELVLRIVPIQKIETHEGITRKILEFDVEIGYVWVFAFVVSIINHLIFKI